MKCDMKWIVWHYNFNLGIIDTYNILTGHISETIKKLLKKESDKKVFAEAVRIELMSTYWGRCEYELIMSAWPPNDKAKERKVDIYEQVILNYDQFIDYLWSFKKVNKNKE